MNRYFFRYQFREVRTPLRYLGIRLYEDQDRGRWIRLWGSRHQRFGKRPLRAYPLSTLHRDLCDKW